MTQRQGFKANEFVVYPAHGVGQILSIEEQEIAGAKLELFVINFIKDKMTLAGADREGRECRHAQAVRAGAGEAGAGDPERPRPGQAHHVVAPRPGIRSEDQFRRYLCDRRSRARPLPFGSQPEQSYSERQLYEAALDRLSREIAVVQHSTETEAVKEIESQLAKSPRRGVKAEARPKVRRSRG